MRVDLHSREGLTTIAQDLMELGEEDVVGERGI